MLLGAALLSGCGTATFTNSFAVAVESRQQVSVFDNSMGDSAEWAGRSMGVAAPGAPYTTQIFATATKLILDSSPPEAVRVGLFLPQITQTGYFAIDVPSVTEGGVDIDAPFVAWYSADPVEQLPSQPLRLEIAAGPDGWIITVDVPE